MIEGWSTEQLALFISVISAIFAGISLYWSIRAFFLYPKSKLDVRLLIDSSLAGDQYHVSAVNMGPSNTVVEGLIFDSGRKFLGRNTEYWRLSLPDNRVEGGRKLHEGQTFPRMLPPGEICRFKNLSPQKMPENLKYRSVAVMDSFGRRHRLPKKHFETLMNALKAK